MGMQNISILEGQTILVGDASIVIERIDFNSTKSFISYQLSEDSSVLEQATLYVGEFIQLMLSWDWMRRMIFQLWVNEYLTERT